MCEMQNNTCWTERVDFQNKQLVEGGGIQGHKYLQDLARQIFDKNGKDIWNGQQIGEESQFTLAKNATNGVCLKGLKTVQQVWIWKYFEWRVWQILLNYMTLG